MWKTKFWRMSSEGLFRAASGRISHGIHIVGTSWSQLPVRSGIFHLLVEVVYWPCCRKFVDPTINLAFQRIIVKVKLPAKFCLHSFGWFLSPNRSIGLMRRVFANGPVDQGSIPGQVILKTQKMVLDAALLNTQHY